MDVSSFSGRSHVPWRFAFSQDLRADRDSVPTEARTHKAASRVELPFPRALQDRPSACRVSKTNRAEARMPNVPPFIRSEGEASTPFPSESTEWGRSMRVCRR